MTSEKTKKQQEELPSFLVNLNQISPGVKLPTKETSNDHYLGPLFFGGCLQHHPPHVIPHEHLPPAIFSTISEQDFLENIFVETSTDKEESETRELGIQKRHHPVRKRKSSQPSVSRYRGVRKVFVPEVGSHEIDFGETESEISGEMCREIPVCRVMSCSSMSERYEMVNLSDIREKNRPYMSYNERISHPHFLKEFVTVKVIGPKIPAAITITKLPTKRKRLSDFNFQLQSEKNEQEKVSEEDVHEVVAEEEENEENEDDDSIKELIKPISIIPVIDFLDDTLDDDEMETRSEMVNEEGIVIEEEENESIYDEEEEEEDGKPFDFDKKELEGNEEIETEEKEEDGAGILENGRPTEEKEVIEEK